MLTPLYTNQHNAKGATFRIYDTGCPVQIRNFTNTKPKKKRWPDAIGIGFAKCGTGSLAFLDCHPSIVFRKNEPNFFNEDVINRILQARG